MKDIQKKNLFYLYSSIVVDGVAVASHILGTNDDPSRLWNIKFEYAEEGALQFLVKQSLLRATIGKFKSCEHCNSSYETIMYYVHIATWRPNKTTSLGDSDWFISFTDDYLR